MYLPKMNNQTLKVDALSCIPAFAMWTSEMLCNLVLDKDLLASKLFVTPITKCLAPCAPAGATTSTTTGLGGLLASSHC
jgi:hypothetical protein